MIQIRSLLISFLNQVRILIISISSAKILLFLSKELLKIIVVLHYVVLDHLASGCPICKWIAVLGMYLLFYLELVFLKGLVLILH
jgi:hypothetical protein